MRDITLDEVVASPVPTNPVRVGSQTGRAMTNRIMKLNIEIEISEASLAACQEFMANWATLTTKARCGDCYQQFDLFNDVECAEYYAHDCEISYEISRAEDAAERHYHERGF